MRSNIFKFHSLLIVAFCFVSMLGWQPLTAQNAEEDEYTTLFKEVKLHLASNQEEQAIQILETLYEKDPSNANVQYLLGYCYVKQRTNIPKAVKLLEKASSNYTAEYDPNSLKETRVSEYVYYYLIIAYSLNGECAKCEKTLNKFYDVYSYFDEWYLVEGQKWVRECNKSKKKGEDEEEENDEVEEELAEETESETTEETEAETTEKTNEQAVEKTQQEIAVEQQHELAKNEQEVIEEEEEINRKKKRKKRKKKQEESESEEAEYTLAEDENNLKKQEIPVRWKENFFASSNSDRASMQKSPEFRDRLLQYDPEKGQIVSKEIHYTTQSSLYGVQVGAFFSPKYTSEFKNLKNIEVYVDQNGVFRYVIGRLVYRMQAEKLLDYVKNMGYADAFIVDINGGKYINEVVTVNNQSLKKKFDGEVDFRVQIGAFTRELPENIARHYLQLEGIKENIEGDLTVLTIGSFEEYENAKAFAEKVKLIGVEDAFVVAYADEAKITVEEALKLSELIKANKAIEADPERNKPFEKKTNQKKSRSSDL